MQDEDNRYLQEEITDQRVMSTLNDTPSVRFNSENESTSISTRQVNSSTIDGPIETSNQTGNKNINSTVILKKIHNHIDQIRCHQDKKIYKNCSIIEWLFVASIIDKFLFFGYCTIVVISTISIFRN
jgi:hypothetical protein